jgi:hypothetical protein
MKINIIYPYKENGLWVFDDPETGLVKEPFILGSGEILDLFNQGRNKLRVLFSDTNYFQESRTIILKRLAEENGGCWYQETTSGSKGWLCPQLFKYFDLPPKQIYVQISLPYEN